MHVLAHLGWQLVMIAARDVNEWTLTMTHMSAEPEVFEFEDCPSDWPISLRSPPPRWRRPRR
jgi:hypothetical protein